MRPSQATFLQRDATAALSPEALLSQSLWEERACAHNGFYLGDNGKSCQYSDYTEDNLRLSPGRELHRWRTGTGPLRHWSFFCEGAMEASIKSRPWDWNGSQPHSARLFFSVRASASRTVDRQKVLQSLSFLTLSGAYGSLV